MPMVGDDGDCMAPRHDGIGAEHDGRNVVGRSRHVVTEEGGVDCAMVACHRSHRRHRSRLRGRPRRRRGCRRILLVVEDWSAASMRRRTGFVICRRGCRCHVRQRRMDAHWIEPKRTQLGRAGAALWRLSSWLECSAGCGGSACNGRSGE
jgi:hypothetical protein